MALPERTNRTFLLLIGLQALHSGEEYATEFYARFPPAVALDHLLPGVARPGFVALNAALISFGLWCYAARVRQGSVASRKWIWVWVGIELFNGIAHPLWAVLVGGYVPGLASAPLLLCVAGVLLWQLRSASANDSS